MDNSNKINVMVIGAAGGIGRVLCAFLANSKFVKKLVLCDIAPTKGIAMELGHLNKGCVVLSQDMASCDKDIDCVLMPCGKPQTSANEKRDDLFKINAKIFQSIMETLSGRLETNPVYIVVGNPVNSLTVVCAETLTKVGKYDPKKLLGLNELDEMRASRLVADLKGLDPRDVYVPLIGGHSEKTITPVLNKTMNTATDKPIELTKAEKDDIFDQVRFMGDRILEAYDNKGTATLSTAISTFRLTKAIFGAKSDDTHIAFVEHGQMQGEVPRFLSVPVKLSREGVKEVVPFKDLVDALEPDARDKLFKEVESNIQTALNVLGKK